MFASIILFIYSWVLFFDRDLNLILTIIFSAFAFFMSFTLFFASKNSELLTIVKKKTLEDAARTGDIKLVKYFLEKNNVYRNTKTEIEALNIASYMGYFEIVKYIHSKAADINAKDKNGNTPLIYAATANFLDIVKYLIDTARMVLI